MNISKIFAWILDQNEVCAVIFTILICIFLPPLLSISYWLILAFPVSIAIPYIESWYLNSISLGWLAPKDVIAKGNKGITRNVKFISLYNAFATAVQGICWICVGVKLGRIAPTVIVYNMSNPYWWCADFLYEWTLLRITWQVWMMLFVADFCNYYVHRFLHQNAWLYKHVHYLHHEFTFPNNSIYALFYVNIWEMMISNFCFFAGMFIFHTDVGTIMAFGTVSSWLVGVGHSSMKLPAWFDRFFEAGFHLQHHILRRVNYSEHFTIMDRLHGTYAAPYIGYE